MTLSNIHRPHAIELPGSVYIRQFNRFATNREYNLFRSRANSAVAPQYSGVDEGNPAVEFSTPDIKTLWDFLNASGTSGLCIGYNTVNTGSIKIYYRKSKNRGFREALTDAVHNRFDMVNNGFLYWTQISATQGSGNQAEVQATLKAISNDGTNPMVHVGSSTCPGDESVNGLYTLGPVKINGSFIDAIQESRLENNIDSDEIGEDGFAFPQYSDIAKWEPMATIETYDVTVMDTFEAPTAITSFYQYFRKLQKNGIPYANDEAVHLKITATVGTVVATEGANTPGRFTIQAALDAASDAAPPFAINTAAAIT